MIKSLLIDNYDSFTYNLKDYLEQAGLSIEVYRNDEISLEAIRAGSYKAIILSPGPGKPSEVPILNQCIDYCLECDVPLLGICLGHQAIGEYFGLKTIKAPLPVHGKTDLIHFEENHPVFKAIDSPTEVMRYHSLVVSGEHEALRQIATNEEGINMAMEHKSKPIFSLQFHPESILTKEGLRMLKNWVTVYTN